MTPSDFFQQLDMTTLTISGIFFGIYLTIYFSLFTNVEPLCQIKERVVKSYLESSGVKELSISEFLNMFDDDAQFIMYSSTRKNTGLHISLFVYLVISILSILYTPLMNLFGTTEMLSNYKDPVLYLYIAGLSVSTLYLVYEFRFYKKFQKAQRHHNNSDNDWAVVKKNDS